MARDAHTSHRSATQAWVVTPWSQPPDAVLASLHSTTRGLSNDEAAARLVAYGSNALVIEKPVPAWRRWLAQFESPVVLVLVGACILAAVLGDAIDAIAIGVILVLNAAIGYAQEVKAEAAVLALKRMAAPRARVMRAGQALEIVATEVVPGDILLLEAGDYVAADARLIEAFHLACGEATLTGESLPVAKTTETLPPDTLLADRLNMVFAGTSIAAGTGRAIVTATGMQTELGRIASLLETTPTQKTPLQVRLATVSHRLLWFATAVTAVIGLLGFLHQEPWLEVILRAVSLAVAAIPEGLPTVVTLALALAVRRMAGRNAIIRQLPAVETLGLTDVICTDKTGTLTTGDMQVRHVYVGGRCVAMDMTSAKDTLVTELLCQAAAASNARIGPQGVTGDTTEIAIVHAAARCGIIWEELEKQCPRLAEWPFDSVRKRMGVAVTRGDSLWLYLKGAPESVLPLCLLREDERQAVEQAIATLSERGERVLAVAKRLLDQAALNRPHEEVERELTFTGLIALADPPRPEAKAAIAACQAAGIRVVMITGDHPATARAIGFEMGVVVPGTFDVVMTGQQLRGISDEELRRQVEQVAVYARVAPEDKLRIVRAWKSRGLVVAMTGDGVNDAPALREASIGVAMGKGGTEVARQASAVVLADDNFATIVAAVEEGRAVHGNIGRTIQYLLAGNIAEIVLMLGAALANWPAPLLPLHLLWINLISDGFPTLALAAEPVPHDALRLKPSGRFDAKFFAHLLLTGLLAASLVLGTYVYVYWYTGDVVFARTTAFTLLVFEELFRSFTARSDRLTFVRMGIRTNLYLAAAVLVPFGLQLVVLQQGFLREIFRVAPLDWSVLLTLAAMALIPATLIEVRKLLRHGWRGER